MDKYTVHMADNGLVIKESSYCLVNVDDKTGAFQFPDPEINPTTLDQAVNLREYLEEGLIGSHYRIFQKVLEEVKVERAY